MFLWIRRLNNDKMLIFIKIPMGIFSRNCEIQGTYITQNNLKYSNGGDSHCLISKLYKVILNKII